MKANRIPVSMATIETKIITKTRKAWIDYLQQFDWEWHVNMSFGKPVSANSAERQLKRWIGNLKKEEKLQVAGVALVNTASPNNIHIHCLLVSKKTPFNATLSTVDKVKWEKRWQGSTCLIRTSGEAAVEECLPIKFSKYFVKEKNLSLYQPDDHQLIIIRPGLLNKMKNIKTAGSAGGQKIYQFITTKKEKKNMKEKSTLNDLSIANLMITPTGVKAFGSIHAAFIMSILTRRYSECREAGELKADKSFICTKTMLEERTGLKIQTVNKHLRTLKKKGAIVVEYGKPGDPRLFKIDDRVINNVADRMNKGSGENDQEGKGE